VIGIETAVNPAGGVEPVRKKAPERGIAPV
jgi:hypothetical protein